MYIFGQHASHDASACVVQDGRLTKFIEHSKLGRNKYDYFDLGSEHITRRTLTQIPDVWAFSCFKEQHDLAVGYFGIEQKHAVVRERRVYGKPCTEVHITHELGHIWSAVAWSRYSKCLVLVIEGTLSGLYSFEYGRIAQLAELPMGIGAKYQALYAYGTANTTRMASGSGKLMALLSLATQNKVSAEYQQKMQNFLRFNSGDRTRFRTTTALTYLNNQLPNDSPGFKQEGYLDACRYFSDAVSQMLREVVGAHNTDRQPLVISGGCGLNCDWNTQLAKEYSVYVPPCPDDSGQSIGAAAYANFVMTGSINLEYDLFCGLDALDVKSFQGGQPLDLEQIANYLVSGETVAWIQGKYCLGPRALGDRSILMSAYREDTQNRMNAIKQREYFRPVAPSVLREDAQACFGEDTVKNTDVYMQFFQKVTNSELKGVTHVDGTARAQYVDARTAPANYIRLLQELKKLQGIGIVANSSLNIPGTGMMHKVEDAFKFCREHSIAHLVVDDRYFKVAA